MKYSKNNLEELVKTSTSLSEVLSKLGLRVAGGNFKTLRKYIVSHALNTDHFKEHRINQIRSLKSFAKPLVEELTVNSKYPRGSLKKRLYKEGLKQRICELCGQGELWKGKKMSLILDHVNGVHNDNRLENLRIVCPNCNATLNTHCGKNNSKRAQLLIQRGITDFTIDMRRLSAKESIVKKQAAFLRRKVLRPDIEVLKEEVAVMGYSAAGRKYGVSDNSIRKWLKA